MRRPRFSRWIRTQVLELAGIPQFNLRRLVSRVQTPQAFGNPTTHERLAAALLLYAHENGQLGRLLELVHDQALASEYAQVEHHLGRRSVERLALRGSPMMQLPESYRRLLEAYARDYHAPERTRAKKERLQERAHALFLRSDLLVAELAQALDLDPGNMHAYLVRKETERFTLDTARAIESYLCGLVEDSTPTHLQHIHTVQ